MTTENGETVAPVADRYVTEDRDTIAADIAAESEDSVPKEDPKPEKVEEKPEESSEKPKRPGRLERIIQKQQQEIESLRQAQNREPIKSDKPVQDGPPNIDDYGDNAIDYVVDLAKYEARQELIRGKEADRVQQTEAQQQAEKISKLEAFQEREAQIIAANPDYDSKLKEMYSEGILTDTMIEEIQDSDMGEKISLHLTKNPELAEAMSEMTNKQLTKVIGILELQLSGEGKAAVKTTKAPQPITPVRANSVQAKDPDDMSYEESLKWRAERRKSQGLPY